MDFKSVHFTEQTAMVRFVDTMWERVFNVHWHDDFDGSYWIVNIMPKVETAKPQIGDILKSATQ